MNNYCVYMHKNKINGKVYIGQTCQDPKDRWKNGFGYKTQEKFYKEIEKYGWNCFEHIILSSNLSSEEADRKEEEMISLYQSYLPDKGYNTYRKNYSGYHFADLWADLDTREKMIIKLTEQRNTEKYHEDQSAKMKEVWKDDSYREKQQKAWTEERRKAASERSKKAWKQEGYKEKIAAIQSKLRKEDWQNIEYRKKMCKAVRCLETGQIFNSIKEAAEYAGIKPNTLCMALKKSKTHRSGSHPETKIPLHWEYYVEVGEEGRANARK